MKLHITLCKYRKAHQSRFYYCHTVSENLFDGKVVKFIDDNGATWEHKSRNSLIYWIPSLDVQGRLYEEFTIPTILLSGQDIFKYLEYQKGK